MDGNFDSDHVDIVIHISVGYGKKMWIDISGWKAVIPLIRTFSVDQERVAHGGVDHTQFGLTPCVFVLPETFIGAGKCVGEFDVDLSNVENILSNNVTFIKANKIYVTPYIITV